MDIVVPPELRDVALYLENKEGISFCKLLGKGSFSVVYEAQCDKQEQCANTVAVKFCRSMLFGDYVLWPKLEHRNLLKLLRKIELNDIELNDSEWKIVYLMPVMLCNLKNYLSITNNATCILSLKLIRDWILGLVKAVKYLHAKKMYHLDVKITNVMINSQNNLILGDFSSLLETEEKISYTQIGLPKMLKPPEVLALEGKVFRVVDPAAVDVWGLALVVVHLILGDSAWKPVILCVRQGGDNTQVKRVILELTAKLNDKAHFKEMLDSARTAPLFSDHKAKACWSFIQMCIHWDPNERKRLFHIAEHHTFLVKRSPDLNY